MGCSRRSNLSISVVFSSMCANSTAYLVVNNSTNVVQWFTDARPSVKVSISGVKSTSVKPENLRIVFELPREN